MSMSFNDLKRSSKTDFEKLNSELSKLNNSNVNADDDKYWSCQRDKAGNGSAVIRFLPAPPNEDMPFVRMYTHGFKGPGGWYIENSLSTIGQPDPVTEMNSALWNEGEGSPGRKRVTGSKDNPGTKRKLTYTSNIYVIKDPANPENEGKVYLFKYGKKIFDKIKGLMYPEPDPLDPKEPINPFDFWSGANFKLTIRNVEGYANFDKSEFYAPGPLSENDEDLENIWKSQHSLQALVDPKTQFKTYEKLKERLDRVMGVSSTPAFNTQQPVQDFESAPQPVHKSTPPTAHQTASTPPWDSETETRSFKVDDDEDDDMINLFKQLASDD